LVATTARCCFASLIIHRADSLAAGAVSCRLMSSTFTESLWDKSSHRTILALKLTRMGGRRTATEDRISQRLCVLA
jgi:hypothetical protein